MSMKNVEDICQLSPMQQGMLFHTLMAPRSGVYIEQLSCNIEGKLNVAAFEQAWQQVVDRHSILRTAFVWERINEPVQVVYRKLKLVIEQQDWRSDSPLEQTEKLEALMALERKQGFTLSRPPLMNLKLVRIGENTHTFTWSHHHLLLDGWCMPALLQEVLLFYDAFERGETLVLERSRPYGDYIEWLQRQDLTKAEKFWRHLLQGITAPTPLVPGRSAPDSLSKEPEYDQAHILITPDASLQLQDLVRQHQLTINTWVLAAWGLLLSRYSGANQVLFGVTVSGRPPDLAGVETMMGLFINTLPVRLNIEPEQSLISWLKEIQDQQVELRQYEYTPLVQIQGWSDIPRDLPMFESIFVFENYPMGATISGQDGNLKISNIRTHEQTNYPLTVVSMPGNPLSITIHYDCNRFDRATITRMLGHVKTLLEEFVTNLNQPLDAISLLTESEWQQQVLEWNDTQTDFSGGQCIQYRFEDQVEKSPGAVALVFEQRQFTYQELNQWSNQIAHVLRNNGVGPEILVGICVDRSPEMIAGILGILKAGGAYVPIDPSYPPERIEYMIKDSGITILLTQSELIGKLNVKNLQLILLDSSQGEITLARNENPEHGTKPGNLAYTIYTSGSTGRPKGVLLQHHGLCNLVQAITNDWGIKPGSRVLQFFSFAFDGSVFDIFATLVNGATLFLVTKETLLSVEELTLFLQNHNITLILFPPSLLSILPSNNLPALATVVSGGESCSREVAMRWANGHRVINAYGPTEATVACASYPVREKIPGTGSVPIGQPIANSKIFILDKYLNPVPVGVAGELHVSGAGLARGYLNRPELTAEKFIPNPFNKNDDYRLYKTGDLARFLPDGNIEFLGRIDFQVKIRGFRVELEEIAAVLRQHPAIQNAIVIARDEKSGDKRLVAYCIPEQNIAPGPGELRQFLQKTLPDYMIPSSYVMMDSFPLTANGKVDRSALPAPGQSRPDLRKAYVAPRDAVELQLVKIWEEVLGIKPIGVTDNFFELGGHSMLAIKVLAQIQHKFNRDVPLVSLFQHPTIENLAGAICQDENVGLQSTLVELQKGNSNKKPFFMVHPSGGSVHWYTNLARLIGPDQSFYGIQAAGPDQARNHPTRIEAMAASYVKAIRSYQPEGPYLIGSWSFGVIVVYEMAQQLYHQGQHVALLVLFDQGPEIPIREPADQAEFLANLFTGYFSLALADLRQLEPDDQLKLALRQAKKHKVLPRYLRLGQFRNYVHIMRTQQQAWRNYAATSYPGRITLFRTNQHDDTAPAIRDLGWGQLAHGGVEVVVVPGDHISMLQEPHVQVLAQRLREFIDTAQKSG